MCKERAGDSCDICVYKDTPCYSRLSLLSVEDARKELIKYGITNITFNDGVKKTKEVG